MLDEIVEVDELISSVERNNISLCEIGGIMVR